MRSMISRLKSQTASMILRRLLPNGYYFRRGGFCPCCSTATVFISHDPWLRDNFKCEHCNSIPRNRALITVLEKFHPNWRDLTIHESSPSGGGASARMRKDCAGYTSTQYYPEKPPGSMVGEFRNEDLERQTFTEAKFDIVITQDVLEHVYDPAAVFREIARTLKPGGSHVFSVPLVNKHLPTQVWAMRNPDGSPNFLHEPDYHGNPVDPRGSPVTMRWGYDIVGFIERESGLQSTIEYIDDLERGIRAEFIEIMVTHKPPVAG